MQLRILATLALSGALLAACSDSDDVEEADDAPSPPAVELTPAPVATAAPDGSALVPGQWSVNESADGASAMFGEPETDATLSIECDAASKTATFAIASAATQAQSWRLDAGGEAARIDLAPDEAAGLPYLEAQIEPGLAIFHAFSNPGAIVTLTSPEGERMQFPTHPGVSRVLYACS